MSQINSEDSPEYQVEPANTYESNFSQVELDTIAMAIRIIDKKFTDSVDHETRLTVFETPGLVKKYCKLQIGHEKSEKFGIMFLNTRHKLISFDIMSHGTIDGASVHPREIIKRALHHNAAALILTHNHPSGNSAPSQADRGITDRIIQAAKLMEIRVLDHIIVSNDFYSFTENGLI